MPLSDVACRNAKATDRPLKISDSGGLHLLVQPSGSKLWRLAYRYAGKQKTLALGAYPSVPLAEARRRRDAAKQQLASGVDPSIAKKEEKRASRLSAENHFEGVAREWFAARQKSWVPSYSERLLRRLPLHGHFAIRRPEAPSAVWALNGRDEVRP